MSKSHFGLIGLGVMGENLVLNAERNGFSSVVYNRTYAKPKTSSRGVARTRTFRAPLTSKISLASWNAPAGF